MLNVENRNICGAIFKLNFFFGRKGAMIWVCDFLERISVICEGVTSFRLSGNEWIEKTFTFPKKKYEKNLEDPFFFLLCYIIVLVWGREFDKSNVITIKVRCWECDWWEGKGEFYFTSCSFKWFFSEGQTLKNTKQGYETSRNQTSKSDC